MSSIHDVFSGFTETFGEDWGQMRSDETRARYEAQIVSAARAIVASEKDCPPTVEHMRVVLDWLDGTHGIAAVDEETPPF